MRSPLRMQRLRRSRALRVTTGFAFSLPNRRRTLGACVRTVPEHCCQRGPGFGSKWSWRVTKPTTSSGPSRPSSTAPSSPAVGQAGHGKRRSRGTHPLRPHDDLKNQQVTRRREAWHGDRLDSIGACFAGHPVRLGTSSPVGRKKHWPMSCVPGTLSTAASPLRLGLSRFKDQRCRTFETQWLGLASLRLRLYLLLYRSSRTRVHSAERRTSCSLVSTCSRSPSSWGRVF